MSFYRKSEGTHKRGFFNSLNTALEGVVHTLQFERNMRIHFLTGFLVVIAGIFFHLGTVEFLLLCFAVTLVLVAEMFNTGVEHVVDLLSGEYHPLAKIVKDVAAGAVFVTAVNAAIVGYLLFLQGFTDGFRYGFMKLQESPWHVTLIALLVIVGLVLFIKVMRREKMLLRGGMPSGHSAVAFGVWMLVTLFSGNMLVSFLVLLLALMVGKSRMENGVHRAWEVVAGSLLGASLALLIYQILS